MRLIRSRRVPQKFTASVWREGRWWVAQCLEVDLASQGRSEKTALKNLGDALALHFSPPIATATPRVRAVPLRPRAA
jgi:hypothetical protein